MNDLLDKNRRLPRIRIVKGNLETYEIVDTLQDSLYGKVYQGFGLDSGKLVAIKVLSKNDIITRELNRSLPETPLAEVFFADEMANHEYLATIRDVFETEDSHYIVSDLADGEDLLELLKSSKHGLKEDQARICMKQAAKALSVCHERGFALQDFSLENCLLYSVQERSNDENESENRTGVDGPSGGRMALELSDSSDVADKSIKRRFQIKVCDPGQAVRFGRYNNEIEIPVPHLGCVGKRFRPPEIFSGRPYMASKVDSWCLGWSTFYLLFGRALFESVYSLDNDVRWQWYSMGYRDHLYSYLDVKDRLSLDARSFIESLVHPDPICRMSVKDALNHPFLRDVKEADHLVLENWGRSSFFANNESRSPLESLKDGVSDKKIPFIPDVYKSKYLGMYCTGDKPSGYFPPNAAGLGGGGGGLKDPKLVMVQNQKPVTNNSSVPVTARYYPNKLVASNIQNLLGGGSSSGCGIFQKRKSGARATATATATATVAATGGAGKRTRGRTAMTTAIAAAVGLTGGAAVEGAGVPTEIEEGSSEDGEGGFVPEAMARAAVVNTTKSRVVPMNPSHQVGGLSSGLGVMEMGYNPSVYRHMRYHQQSINLNGYYGHGGYGVSCFGPGMGGAYNSRYFAPSSSGNYTRDDVQRLVLETAASYDGLDLTRTGKKTAGAGGAKLAAGLGAEKAQAQTPIKVDAADAFVDLNKGRMFEGVRVNGGDSMMMCRQNYGYSSSYVPAPTGGVVGMNAGAGGQQQHYLTGQSVRNFSYVPPALTSRHQNRCVGCGNFACNSNSCGAKGTAAGRGHNNNNLHGHLHQTWKGVSSRINYGPMSYVPPPMRI